MKYTFEKTQYLLKLESNYFYNNLAHHGGIYFVDYDISHE